MLDTGSKLMRIPRSPVNCVGPPNRGGAYWNQIINGDFTPGLSQSGLTGSFYQTGNSVLDSQMLDNGCT